VGRIKTAPLMQVLMTALGTLQPTTTEIQTSALGPLLSTRMPFLQF